MFLLPGLKRFCANAMAKFLTVSDVVTVLKTARMFNLPRLEDQCAEFMAQNLEQVNMPIVLDQCAFFLMMSFP